jgi:hypothetical protein
MTYPLSNNVTAGQPTAADHYNNLRADALRLGNADADSVNLATFFKRYVDSFTINYLATNRLIVPYSVTTPPTIMINGCLLQATASVALPAGQFSGAAATWYIFAVRTAGSTSFTLIVNTSAVEGTDQRLVGECVFDGSNITSVTCYFTPVAGLAAADYDSGWFAVSAGNTYTKAHGLGQAPRQVVLLWNSASNGSSSSIPVQVVYSSSPAGGFYSPVYFNGTNVIAITGSGSSSGTTVNSTFGQATSGYWRILAWK